MSSMAPSTRPTSPSALKSRCYGCGKLTKMCKHETSDAGLLFLMCHEYDELFCIQIFDNFDSFA